MHPIATPSPNMSHLWGQASGERLAVGRTTLRRVVATLVSYPLTINGRRGHERLS